MTLKTTDRIEAEVVLRPRAKAPVRAKSVARLEADPETVKKVVRKLSELGFEVLVQSPTSISIAGTRLLFSRVFETSERPDAMSLDLNVPKDLEDYVEGVYVQAPPTYFQ